MVGRRSTKDVATDESSEDATNGGSATLYGFRAVYVSMSARTEGKELPTLTEVNGDVSGYRERLFEFVEAQSVEIVSLSRKLLPQKVSRMAARSSCLSGMQPAEEFSTLVHEIAHEMLHRGDRRTLTTKQVRETEAEAWHLWFANRSDCKTEPHPRTTSSFGTETPIFCAESLEAVQQTAAVILGGIAPEPAALAVAA